MDGPEVVNSLVTLQAGCQVAVINGVLCGRKALPANSWSAATVETGGDVAGNGEEPCREGCFVLPIPPQLTERSDKDLLRQIGCYPAG